MRITKLLPIRMMMIAVTVGATTSAFEHYYRKTTGGDLLSSPFFERVFRNWEAE